MAPRLKRNEIVRPLLLLATLAGCARKPSDGYQGYLEGEFIQVASPLAGRVDQVTVTKGDRVDIGAPLFTLERVERRLFTPMAFTVCYALVGSLLIALTLIPVLATYLFRNSVFGIAALGIAVRLTNEQGDTATLEVEDAPAERALRGAKHEQAAELPGERPVDPALPCEPEKG